MEVTDRLMYLEQRLQMQEDEVQLLKITLADVLKRLNISKTQTAALTKRGPVKASRPVSSALPPRTNSNTANFLKKSSSSALPSSSSCKNYSPLPTSKRSPASNTKGSSSVQSSALTTSTATTPCKKLQERDSSGGRCEMEVRERSEERRRPETIGRASRALDATPGQSQQRRAASVRPRQPATPPAC
ncbi:hypothetical protein HF521_012116 [Silurus meridionalis]|uniref:Echinoderm microtubule-associated protein-like 1 n=1 Tax=Silurus meridionalis TaxID=175797 RepID=A0A8T0AGK8_SILME|nr:hypothetical protein HF521_012116 [Silurus meridionalis]